MSGVFIVQDNWKSALLARYVFLEIVMFSYILVIYDRAEIVKKMVLVFQLVRKMCLAYFKAKYHIITEAHIIWKLVF